MQTGIIIVDHGSRREESNHMLEELAGHFAKRFSERYDIVEPAHMELAEPSIATAYARVACVARSAFNASWSFPSFSAPENTGPATSPASPPTRLPSSPKRLTTSARPSASTT